MVVNEYLGIKQLPPRARHYLRAFLVFQTFSTFLLVLSSTFFVLYSIDRIGFALTSFTLSFLFLVQLLTDYPSGSLGDWIGQRWVLVISYISYGIAFFLTMFAQSFTSFMIIAFFNGFGNAQNSGALGTWLDNNYKRVIGDADSERKVYGFSTSRVTTMTRVASAFSFIIGGALATAISREFVFGFQSVFIILVIILVLALIRDEKVKENLETSTVAQKSSNGYLTYLVGGIKFLVSNKGPFFFIIGTALYFSAISIWGSIILIPLYFGYTGSDALASTLRTLAFVVGVPISIYIAKVSQRFNKDKAPHATFGFVILFFPGFVVLTFLVPVSNEFNLIGCAVTIILLNGIIPTLGDLGNILRQRVIIDMVNSENRNAVYSLIPSIVSILGIFLLPISGILIEEYSLTAGIAAALVVGLLATVMIMIGMHFYKLETSKKVDERAIQLSEISLPGP
ncbi:MAG: MFS transporter [Candidatus Odinarchaeota archaeon]